MLNSQAKSFKVTKARAEDSFSKKSDSLDAFSESIASVSKSKLNSKSPLEKQDSVMSKFSRKNSSLLTLLKRKTTVISKKKKSDSESSDMFSETELRARMENTPLTKVEEEKLKQQALSKEFENLQP